MSIISEKVSKHTKFKKIIAEVIREHLPDIPQIYDSLDEVTAEMVPCTVLSFDKGVSYELLSDTIYDARAKLSVDIFLSLNEEMTIQKSDTLSESLTQHIVSNKKIRDICQTITIDEVSAQNLPGEKRIRVVMHDLTMSFLWSPDAA